MRTNFVSASIPLAMALLALAGCLDRELVPLDASPDAIASDSIPDGASACGAACDADHCVEGACVACTTATEADDCTTPELPACVANACASCRGTADCDRFTDTSACATSGELGGQCVACDADSDCTDPLAARCDATTKTCGACVADADCTDPLAARCDVGTHTCAPCNDSVQCAGTGENVCDDGACVACTEDTAAAHCGANACDPVALTCTTTARDSLGSCQPCLSDTECFGDAACVPMRFVGAEIGHYCLTRPPVGGCLAANAPYRVAIANRTSRSGAAAAVYCGINEDLTTCDAVRGSGAPCVEGSETCGPGGLCALVGPAGGGSFRCTYLCVLESECPTLGDLSQCVMPLSGARYCGRR